eukprot:CAMPEP_0184031918 /NCGR_PEP_ID=MMETSP0955-20130417/2624_1 /TAXON_ID=627963 /ORGANISM="Aplanochytrium sp, Strain PBS07" /LENGTH=246 /DNA_ID=CAMNT_0026317805 /DNA_START=222 /DNA_END=963 /DNA_ORIENTATION=-
MASIDPQPLHVVSEHEVASMANLNLLQQQGFSVPNLFAQSLMPMGPSMTQNVQPLPNANPAASFYLPTGPGMPLSVGASKKVAAPVPMLPAMANLEDLPSSLLRQQQEQQILLSNYLTGNKIKGLKRPHSSIGMLTPGTLLGYDNLAAAAGITRIQTNPVKKTRNGRRVCLVDGCIRFAQGKTKRCISHGGGKRCGQSGCPKSAYGSTKFCIAHGGGERCEEKDVQSRLKVQPRDVKHMAAEEDVK